MLRKLKITESERKEILSLFNQILNDFYTRMFECNNDKEV